MTDTNIIVEKKEHCFACLNEREVAAITKKGPLCASCLSVRPYYDVSKHEHCSACGHLRYVASRDEKDNPFCPKCHLANRRKNKDLRRKCECCGKPRLLSKNRRTGRRLCTTCRNNLNVRECAVCLKPRVIQAFDRCRGCYTRKRRGQDDIVVSVA